jgi:hypothetical protein
MNAHSPFPPEPPPPHADACGGAEAWERALLDRQLQMLERLAGAGLAIALDIADQAKTGEAGPVGERGDIAMAYARVARAVRMTIMLQSKLVRDFKAPPQSASRSASASGADDGDYGPIEIRWQDSPELKAARRIEAQDAIRRIAEDAALDTETVERLVAETGERLDRDDIYNNPARRFDKLVAMICKDIGLERPPPLAAANGGGGPSAAEPMVERAGGFHPPFNGSS